MSVETSSQLDFSKIDLHGPKYKYRQTSQYQGYGSSLPINASEQQSIFKIPEGAYNFSKSYLQFDFACGASAGGRINALFTAALPIREITLQNQQGQVLANLRDVAPYNKTARFMMTSLDDYLTRESVVSNTNVNTNCYNSTNYYCQPAQCPNSNQTTLRILANASTAATIVTPAYPVQPDTINAAYPSVAGGQNAEYKSHQHLTPGAVNAISQMRCRIDLSAFVGTMLAMDKDVYCHGEMQLVIYWRPLSYWGFTALPADPAPLPQVLNNPAANALQNYYLYLAEDNNIQTAMETRAAYMGGLEMYVPYTVCSNVSIPANSNGSYFTMNVPLVQGSGLALKRIVTVAVSGSNNLSTTADNQNVDANGAGTNDKWSAIQTRMDGKPISGDFYLVDTLNQPWNYIRNLIKNSPSGLTNRIWHVNNFWCDNFSADVKDSTEFNYDDFKLSGLMLDTSKNYEYSILVSNAQSIQLFSYQTWVRKLYSDSQGLHW